MEIVIGRDPQSRQLCVIKDGMTTQYGQPGSVPMDVSRSHVSLLPSGEGTWILRNLNERNVTFVNGIAVESKTVTVNDRVELGNSRYLLSWSAITGKMEESVDISLLRKVWDRYQHDNDDVEIRKQKLALAKQRQNILRGLTGIFIPLAIVLSIMTGRDNPFFIIFYCIPPLITIVMTYNQYNGIKRDEEDIVRDKERKREREVKFRRDYSCPKCGMYLSLPFDVLERYDCCPYCKVKFRGV